MVRTKGLMKNLGSKGNSESVGLFGTILSMFNFHNINTCKDEDDSFFCRFSRFFNLFIMILVFIIILSFILFIIYKFTSNTRGVKKRFFIF